MFKTYSVTQIAKTSKTDQIMTELDWMPSISGENLFSKPKEMPLNKTKVTKAITGMYRSGAFTS